MAVNGGATYTINLTGKQAGKFEAAGIWPRCPTGDEYCQVSRGAHVGEPTFSDQEIEQQIEQSKS
jgi:hypothetical protein